LTLVSKNFSRRKGRSILSSIGLILAIAVIVSTFTVSRSMEVQVGDELEKYGPNIVVTPRASSIMIPYGNIVVGNTTIPEDSVSRIYQIPNKANLRVVSPKLYGQVEYGNSSLLLVGMVSDREIELRKWWNISGAMPQNDTNEVLVGASLAESLSLSTDSSIRLMSASFSVVGLIGDTGSVDDYSMFIPLHVAQRLLGLNNSVSLVDVGALCKDCPVETIAQQIMDTVPGVKATPVKQAVQTRMAAVEQTASFSLLLATIVLVVGCAGVMNTMLASVNERIKEIGIFMSLGADKGHLWKMFSIESAILGLVGGLVGTILGLLSAGLLGSFFIGVHIDLAEIPLYLIPSAIALSILTCLAASLYPTWRASRIDPVKALKTV
jgi:putative ABC transport system permease protein